MFYNIFQNKIKKIINFIDVEAYKRVRKQFAKERPK